MDCWWILFVSPPSEEWWRRRRSHKHRVPSLSGRTRRVDLSQNGKIMGISSVYYKSLEDISLEDIYIYIMVISWEYHLQDLEDHSCKSCCDSGDWSWERATGVLDIIWWFPEIGGTPKSSILMGFSIKNHPLWGTLIYGNLHLYTRIIPWWSKESPFPLCDPKCASPPPQGRISS